MCEFNSPYPASYCKNPNAFRPAEIRVLPPEAWARRMGELATAEVADINQAVQEAAAIAADVHLYRSPKSPFLGISLEPGSGPNVKIWEH